jgi:WW domain-containing oxidoreductase
MTAYSLHPGTLVPTAIGRNSLAAKILIQLVRPFTKTLGQGAATSVLCSAHPAAEAFAGEYFSNCKPVRSSRESCDPAVAERLWALTEEWVS